MSTLRITRGRVIDPAAHFDAVADLWLAGGRVVGVGPQPTLTADSTLDAAGLIVAPGPINRGVELTPDVADGPNSAILDQVTNGVAVRMAVLHALCGG